MELKVFNDNGFSEHCCRRWKQSHLQVDTNKALAGKQSRELGCCAYLSLLNLG